MRNTYLNCHDLLKFRCFRKDSTQVKQISRNIYIYMQFTPRKAEYPLQGTESEEKEEKYEKHIEESQKESKHKRCLLILGLKPFRS